MITIFTLIGGLKRLNNKMKYIDSFDVFESKSNIRFNKKLRKAKAKTDIYDVIKDNKIIGQIKWSSRIRGYSFLPSEDCSVPIKAFIKKLMTDRNKSKL